MTTAEPFSQKAKINDLASPVGLVKKYALRDLALHGDGQAHRAIKSFLKKNTEKSLNRLGLEAIETIETRIGLGDFHVDVPPVSGRHDCFDASVLMPPPLPLDKEEGKRRPTESFDPRRLHDETASDQVLRAQLIEAALKGIDKKVEPREYGYRVEVPLLGDRRQFVRIAYERSDFENDKIIIVYTVCGPITEGRFKWALQMNRKLDHGKIAIGNDADGGECFLLMQTLIERTANIDEMRKAVLTIAEKGDRIERLLTGLDIH
jgi:hypothetical protein